MSRAPEVFVPPPSDGDLRIRHRDFTMLVPDVATAELVLCVLGDFDGRACCRAIETWCQTDRMWGESCANEARTTP
jgi:hypothetical protein